ncbi:uncharacterized protein YjbJ (UPF0337 family) [Labrenzia sp. MBR-25]|jgi:uncharacterized protein YjbJ (UPF0337 family)
MFGAGADRSSFGTIDHRNRFPCVIKTRRKRPMNWDRIEGNWKEFKGKAIAQWGKLTDDEVDRVDGRRTELAGLIQQKYGKTREEAEKDIEDWLSRH